MDEDTATPQMLDRWVTEYQPIVFKAAWLILRDTDSAEDVAQETFVKAYNATNKLKPGDDIRGWPYRIATNTALNVLRSRRRELVAMAKVGVAPTRTADAYEALDTRSVIAGVLDEMPDRLRVVLVLRYFLDLTERDIAKTLKIRPGTVKSRLHEARHWLAEDITVADAAGQTG